VLHMINHGGPDARKQDVEPLAQLLDEKKRGAVVAATPGMILGGNVPLAHTTFCWRSSNSMALVLHAEFQRSFQGTLEALRKCASTRYAEQSPKCSSLPKVSSLDVLVWAFAYAHDSSLLISERQVCVVHFLFFVRVALRVFL
jgi:hypothetical protein